MLDQPRARVFDLEQPRFAGMPIHPGAQARLLLRAASPSPRLLPARAARPALRRVGHAHDDGAQRHAHRRPVPPGVRPEVPRRHRRRRRRAEPTASRRSAPRRCGRCSGAACCSTWPAGSRSTHAAAALRDHRRRPDALRARSRSRSEAGRRAAGAHRLRAHAGPTRRPT